MIRREPDREELFTIFTVQDVDGMRLVQSDSNVFRTFDGSAHEQQQICAAVIAFCEVAEK